MLEVAKSDVQVRKFSGLGSLGLWTALFLLQPLLLGDPSLRGSRGKLSGSSPLLPVGQTQTWPVRGPHSLTTLIGSVMGT